MNRPESDSENEQWYKVSAAGVRRTVRELVSSEFATGESRIDKGGPQDPDLPYGEWYCENPDCIAREVKIQAKKLCDEDQLPGRIYCPLCRKTMNFHHWIKTFTLVKQDPYECVIIDATSDPVSESNLIPAGHYLAVITESKQNLGSNFFVYLAFEIIEGNYAGRKIWVTLLLGHSDPKFRRDARKKLTAICLAVGVLRPNDSQELHGIPLVIKVGVTNFQDALEPEENFIKDYRPQSSRQLAMNRRQQGGTP